MLLDSFSYYFSNPHFKPRISESLTTDFLIDQEVTRLKKVILSDSNKLAVFVSLSFVILRVVALKK